MPAYLNYDNAALGVPYVLPYGKPDEWASIPGDIYALNRFSLLCLHTAVDIFKEMEKKQGGQKILVGNLMGASPAVYIPVSCGGQFGFARGGDEVVHSIQIDMEMLA